MKLTLKHQGIYIWQLSFSDFYYSVNKSSRYKGVFDDNFSYFSSKPYVVTPHLNHLAETVQTTGHAICFYEELIKIIPNYHQIFPLI